MVAGPNGSGKSTLIHTLRLARGVTLPERYINADDLRRERAIDARRAQKLAETLRLEAIARRESFLYETVMSHPSKIAELQAAAQAGYALTVIFIATEDPAVNIERVRLRVADGGHDVPRDRIRPRHVRSLALAPSAVAFATHAYIYDNTRWGTESARQLQAVLVGNRLRATVDQPAAWVAALIEKVEARAAELDDLHRAGHPLVLPNLYAGVTEGVIAIAGAHYAVQLDQAAAKAVLHDKALLPKPVVHREHYRIAYHEGVATITRRASGRIRAVTSA